jgi:N-acetylglucosamine-6-phosphate deacetylase
MTDKWLLPELVFDGDHLRPDMALNIRDGRIVALTPRNEAHSGAEPVSGIVGPGFIDLQVNGGGGFLLNATPTADAMSRIAAAHRPFGTVGILPTVITDTPEVMAAAVDAALEAQSDTALLGLHIEGPHIAPPRRGTHAERFIRPMDASTIAHVERLRAAGIPVMITLAPEAATTAQIRALADTGAIISIGHSDATADETHAAIAAGATCATHLFNAMSPMLNRAPGVVGAVINSDIHAGLIVDGYHVADEMIALAIRARPVADRMFLVSDAMPTVGGPDQFDLYAQSVRLCDGRLVNAEGSLAGAHLTQATGLHRLHTIVGIDRETALRMAISIPARLIGRESHAGIINRPVSEIIRLSDDLSFSGYLLEP